MTRMRLGALASDRLAAMQGVRLVAGAATGLILVMMPEVARSDWPAVPALLGWLVLTTIVEVLRRSRQPRPQSAASAALALDVLMISVVIARSGGYRSPLTGLVYLHVVAVSLLLSHRIGMRVALLHGISLIASFVLAASGQWDGLGLPADTSISDGARLAALHAGAFLAVALGVTVFSAINEQVSRRAHDELALLARVGETLGALVAQENALTAAAGELYAGMEAEAVAIAVVERGAARSVHVDDRSITFAIAHGALPTIVGSLTDSDLVQSLADLGEPLEMLMPGRRNVIVAPFHGGDVPGVVLVAVGGGARTSVPTSTVLVVEQVARLLGSAVERARLHADLERLATTDPLTGLANRRTFEEALHRELERARRTGEPFSLAILDIDHFKRVNDENGHDVGDAVLRTFGHSLAAEARDADLPARFGGEEFVLLLTGCDERDAFDAVDRLRRSAVKDTPLPITASAGVATFAPGLTESTLFAAADTALYRAKREGRDRTVAAPPGRRQLVAVAS